MHKMSGFHDCMGNLYYGSDNEIIKAMSLEDISVDLTPIEFKESVAMRAWYLGVEINYDSAESFLNELERVGLGYRFNSKYPDHFHKVREIGKK